MNAGVASFRMRISTICTLFWIMQTVVACSDSGEGGESNLISDLASRAEQAGYQEQYEVLATGEVTEDDFLAAMRSARECVRELGIDVSPIYRGFDGNLSYEFTVDPEREAQEVAAADECQAERSELVELAYDRLHPRPANQGVDAIQRCMGSAEVETDSLPPSLDEIRELVNNRDPESPLAKCYLGVVASRVVVIE